jgi:Skp family chaperone for outer membrane proteins
MVEPNTQAPEAQPGKLPIDFKGDADGNVKISGGKEVLPAAEKAREGETPAKVEAPAQPVVADAPKMISEEEVNRRLETIKGGHKGTVDKMRGEIEKLNAKIAETTEAMTQKEYDNWIRLITENGDGKSLDLAKQVFSMDKAVRARASDLQKKEAEVLALKKELDEAGKMKFVGEQIKKFGLSEDVFDSLANLEDRGEIKARAAELALEQTKAAAVPPVKTDSSKAQPAPRDFSKMPLNSRLGMLMEESSKK